MTILNFKLGKELGGWGFPLEAAEYCWYEHEDTGARLTRRFRHVQLRKEDEDTYHLYIRPYHYYPCPTPKELQDELFQTDGVLGLMFEPPEQVGQLITSFSSRQVVRSIGIYKVQATLLPKGQHPSSLLINLKNQDSVEVAAWAKLYIKVKGALGKMSSEDSHAGSTPAASIQDMYIVACRILGVPPNRPICSRCKGSGVFEFTRKTGKIEHGHCGVCNGRGWASL